MKTITVFTPTYNREKMLINCYNSLLSQTSLDFVWQIIDDGSTDNTEEVVKTFIKEKRIEINYIRKTNGGKISAIRRSMDNTETELWMCLDSDDYLFPDAIESILNEYSQIRERNNIAGMITVRSDRNGYPMQGHRYKRIIANTPEFLKFMDFRYKYKIPVEYVQIYRFAVIRNYPFPFFEGEKFMPESSVYCLIDNDYLLKRLTEPIMVSEYQLDGITTNHKEIVRNNPKGYTYTHAIIANNAPTLKCFIHSVICYHMGRALGGLEYSIKKNKVLVKILKPIGLLAKVILYA